MINPASIFKMKGAWEKFTANHPRVPAFMQAASQGMLEEGSIIDLTIVSSDGRKIQTNVRLTESDMELFRELQK